MTWIYRLQQRISITSNEFTAILVISLLLLIGIIARYIQSSTPEMPAGTYARDDRLFEEGTLALKAASERADESHPSILAESDSVMYGQVTDAVEDTHLRFNLNTATADQLEQLPRIGPTMAERILDYRTAHGPFKHVEDLTLVQGIGEKTLALLLPLVYVEE